MHDMGAWGSGSFDNDAALDWAGSVESIADVREPFDRLKSLGDGFVDADVASEVVSAVTFTGRPHLRPGRQPGDTYECVTDQL